MSEGVDFLKLYTRVDRSLLVPIMDEVRTFNVRVSAHLGLVDARTAARAGVGLHRAHERHPGGRGRRPLGTLCGARPLLLRRLDRLGACLGGTDSAGLAAVAAELAERRVVVVPTLVLHETMSRLDDSTLLQDSMYLAVPEFERRRWNVPDMVARAGWSRQDFEAFREARLVQDRFLRDFFARGGLIAAGTDAANQLMVPGYGLHREMELLAKPGSPPAMPW